MKRSDFRKELTKIMPGYKWTLRAGKDGDRVMLAEGIQSSGSNRLSTLSVERRDNYAASGKPIYEVKSAGYGKRAPWLHTATDWTLARALRNLQEYYERMATMYSVHASDLRTGRAAKGGDGEGNSHE